MTFKKFNDYLTWVLMFLICGLLLSIMLSGCVVDNVEGETITIQHTVSTQGIPCIVYVEQGGLSCQWN